jgi:hypothetical protein
MRKAVVMFALVVGVLVLPGIRDVSVPERGGTSARRAAASDSAGYVNSRAADERTPLSCFLSSRTAGSDRVTFAYVPGGSTLGAFAAFPRDDGALFRRLGQSPIRFCTTSADVARKARGLCYRLYQPTGLAMNPALIRPGDPVVRR